MHSLAPPWLSSDLYIQVAAALGPLMQLASLLTWLGACCAGPIFLAVKNTVMKPFQKNMEKKIKEKVNASAKKNQEAKVYSGIATIMLCCQLQPLDSIF